MKWKYSYALADHLRAIRPKLAPPSWDIVVSAIVAFCAQSGSTFNREEFLRYLNRRE